MLTCENCGKTFQQTENLQEVTTLRVLCPPCTAARAAAKARKLDGVRAGPEPQAARAAAPVPAKKLQARNDARPAPSEARPARPDARPAQPEPHTARAAEVASRPAKANASAAAPAPAATRASQRPTPRKPRIDVDALESHNLQKRGSRELWVAFAIALVVFGAAGGLAWKVLGQKAAEKRAEEARQATIAGFTNEFRSIDISTEEGARRLLAFADEKKHIYAGVEDLESLEAEVITRTAKANTLLETLAERAELTRRLTAIEETLARAAELSPNELSEQRRRLEELRGKAGFVGPEFEARLEKDRAEAERVHLERLMAAADAAAATEPLDRAALTTLAQTEDEVFKILDSTAKLWEKNRTDAALSEKKNAYQEQYKRVMKLSDDAVERFFTPEVIEAVPWRDLLEDPKAWKTTTLKGFEHRIDANGLHLVGPDPDADGQAVMSIGDKEIWRDFVVEMELTISKGDVDLFFRLPPNWQKNVESVTLTTDETGLEAGRTYTYVYTLLASTLIEENIGEDSLGPTRSPVNWTQIRKGAFGVAVPKNTEVKFTKLRAKVLR